MKNLILLIFMLCLATPVMAQVNNQEVHDAVSRAVDAARAKAEAERKSKKNAKKQKAQQQVQEIENRTQLGIQRNQQQVQRLENGYGVNELHQRNTMNRPSHRNVRKTKINKLQHVTPSWEPKIYPKGKQVTDRMAASFRPLRPIRPQTNRPPRRPRAPMYQNGNKRVNYITSARQQVPPHKYVSNGRTVNRRGTAKRNLPPKAAMNEDDFFQPRNKQPQTITWRNVKPGFRTKDVAITHAVMRYNTELMYHVGMRNRRFDTQGKEPLIVIKRGDYYIVQSSRVLRK